VITRAITRSLPTGRRRSPPAPIRRWQATALAGNPAQLLTAALSQCHMLWYLNEAAHRACFIANSVNFPVRCEPTIISS
jgi:organic hydroperoxide reductase OsmC/OhrA